MAGDASRPLFSRIESDSERISSRQPFVISAMFASIGSSHVRGSGSSCAAMVYGDQNQIDTKLRVRDLKGIVIDEQNVPVPPDPATF